MLDGKFCAACQKKGHVCPAATVEDGIGLCAFCQDGEECPVSKREKEVAERFGKAAAGTGRPGGVKAAAAAVAPAKVKVQQTQKVKEEKTMEKKCKCGCGAPVSEKRDYKNGHAPKGEAKPKSEAVPPRKPVSKPARAKSAKPKPLARAAAAAGNGDGVATICVPETALDQFWASRNLDEKAHLFTEFLTGAK